jgi:uncharacterized protein involved in exopolysaccharide biosynthesis
MPRDSTVRVLPPDPELPVGILLRPYRRRWRFVLAITAIAWLVALAAVLIPARRYSATVVLAAVPNARTSALSGGLTAILGSAQLGGVQSTPYFIAKLLLLRSVITQVAQERMPDARGGTVIERVLEKPGAAIKPTRVEPAMRDIISADVDKQTGLIAVRVTHSDSAVVRQIVTRLVETASQTFVRVSRAQATSQRAAQGERVDSARRQLRQAEERVLSFLSANRAFTTFSPASISRQNLEREVTNAQTVYSQARADYDAAVGRELEETPAVVIVDPIPARLLPDPLHLPLAIVLASALALLVATVVLWARGEFREPPRPVAAPAPVADPVARTDRGLADRGLADRVAGKGT